MMLAVVGIIGGLILGWGLGDCIHRHYQRARWCIAVGGSMLLVTWLWTQ